MISLQIRLLFLGRRAIDFGFPMDYDTNVFTGKYILSLTFAYDKRAGKPHYQVRHADLTPKEFEEVFFGPMVVIGRRESALKAVGRTGAGRFLTVVFIPREKEGYHVITGWPSSRKQILLWHREVRKS